ncbi:hypothetical protein EVAR_5921_1 [Eumeta japonica]|uniref:Uncharacterized protein n=1 Tax=Eumeta variegata TaxID=151549 RepID=A0A4C1TDA5_EUMVA|nr:hypothetical protein EVAR_5921_1 [Eumeta japonica]
MRAMTDWQEYRRGQNVANNLPNEAALCTARVDKPEWRWRTCRDSLILPRNSVRTTSRCRVTARSTGSKYLTYYRELLGDERVLSLHNLYGFISKV